MARTKVSREEKRLINEIVYCKKKYQEGIDTANEGLKKWAREQAKKYYAQLPSDIASYLRSVGYHDALRYYQRLKVEKEKEKEERKEEKREERKEEKEKKRWPLPPKPKYLSSKEYRKVSDAFKDFNIPPWCWWPIMMCESSGNPKAHRKTAKEDSRGLFQINVIANPYWLKYDLFNPEVNARLIAEHWMYPVWRQKDVIKTQPNFAAVREVYKHGIRPYWTTSLENRLRNYYEQVVGGRYDVEDENYSFIQAQSVDIDFSPGIKAVGELVKGYKKAFDGFIEKIKKGE